MLKEDYDIVMPMLVKQNNKLVSEGYTLNVLESWKKLIDKLRIEQLVCMEKGEKQ